METTFSTEYNTSKPYIKINKETSGFLIIIIILIIFVFFIFYFKPENSNQYEKKEHMTGGTLTQLFAKDSQDVYLNNNADIPATGNYTLFWNQPTRVANTFMNRGSPLPSLILPDTPMNPNPYALEASNSYYDNLMNECAKPANFTNPVLNLKDVLPDQNYVKSKQRKTVLKTKENKSKVKPIDLSETSNYESVKNEKSQINNEEILSDKLVPTIDDNILPSSLSSLSMPLNPNKPPNPYELANVAKQVATNKNTVDNLPALTQWKPIDYLYQGYYDNLLYNKDCLRNPSSCGSNSGGFRLGEDFNEPTKTLPNVNIDGNVFYPDSYTGSYFAQPNFDIMRPFPVILNKDRV